MVHIVIPIQQITRIRPMMLAMVDASLSNVNPMSSMIKVKSNHAMTKKRLILSLFSILLSKFEINCDILR